MTTFISDFFTVNTPPILGLPAVAIFSIFAIWFSVLDIKNGEIPRILSIVMLSLLCAARVGMIFYTGFSVLGIQNTLVIPFVGGAFALFVFTSVFLLCRGKMGLADVWFATGMGLVLGMRYFIFAVLIACILGLLWFAVVRLIAKLRKRDIHNTLPLIPFLSAGTFLLIVLFLLYSG